MRWSGPQSLRMASIVAVAAFLGAGTYTFWFARGYSYLLDDPEVCVNCHIMRDNYNSWQRSSHQSVECNGCHVPHTFVGKWMTKGINGFNHSWHFTFGPPEVIHAKPRTQRVLQQNCLDCHREMVTFIAAPHEDMGRNCFDCHRGVGHAY